MLYNTLVDTCILPCILLFVVELSSLGVFEVSFRHPVRALSRKQRTAITLNRLPKNRSIEFRRRNRLRGAALVGRRIAVVTKRSPRRYAAKDPRSRPALSTAADCVLTTTDRTGSSPLFVLARCPAAIHPRAPAWPDASRRGEAPCVAIHVPLSQPTDMYSRRPASIHGSIAEEKRRPVGGSHLTGRGEGGRPSVPL